MSSLVVLNILWQVSTLALAALGLAIIFGQLKIMNMAHGEFVMIGAYTSVITSSLGLPAYLQLFVCIMVAIVLALIIEYLIIKHLYGRLFDSLLATWAVGILLREVTIIGFGRSFQNVATPITGTVNVFGADYPVYRLVLMFGIIFAFLALFLWYRSSRLGIKVRAMVANPNLAAAMGFNVPQLSRNVFVFGAVCAALAGWLLAPTTRVDPFMGIDYLVRSFFALVVGGLGTFEGLLLGSATIGGLQASVSSVFDQVIGYVFVLVLSILLLWKKPHGIINAR